MRFRKVIDGTMQGDASGQIVRKCPWQGAFDPVPHNTSHNQGRHFTRKQGMGKNIQEQLSGESAKLTSGIKPGI
jgi:hypothetical protein